MASSASEYSEALRIGSCVAHHRGPAKELGPLPTLLYFSLSGRESLTLDPYAQPVEEWLKGGGRRAISFDLPNHPYQGNHLHAIKLWAERLCVAHEPIYADFFDSVISSLDRLIDEEWIDSQHLAVAGLSRGAFVGTHLTAIYEPVSTVLGFAPLTTFKTVKEFQSYLGDPAVAALDLVNLVERLVKKKTRFYIGNHDERVGTVEAFEFINALTQAAFQAGIRSPQVELIIHPSVGHKGHGTLPEVFCSGIEWLLRVV